MTEGNYITCKKCNSPYFMSVMKIKRISAIVSSDGKEHVFPIPTLVCINKDCHTEVGGGGKEKKDGA